MPPGPHGCHLVHYLATSGWCQVLSTAAVRRCNLRQQQQSSEDSGDRPDYLDNTHTYPDRQS